MISLLIDTREKDTLFFRNTDNYTVISEKLDFGDYGLRIDNKLICVFERKSGLDLFCTLTSGHKRFNEEIQRAKESGIQFYIIIEESYNNIISKSFDGGFRTKMKGYILAKIIHTMMIKHNIQFIFCNDRTEMRDYIRNTFNSLIELLHKSNKNVISEAEFSIQKPILTL